MYHQRLSRVLESLLKLLAIEHWLGCWLLIIIGGLLLWLAFAVVLCSLLEVCHEVRILLFCRIVIMTSRRLVQSAVVWAVHIAFEPDSLTITLLIHRVRRRDLLVKEQLICCTIIIINLPNYIPDSCCCLKNIWNHNNWSFGINIWSISLFLARLLVVVVVVVVVMILLGKEVTEVALMDNLRLRVGIIWLVISVLLSCIFF